MNDHTTTDYHHKGARMNMDAGSATTTLTGKVAEAHGFDWQQPDPNGPALAACRCGATFPDDDEERAFVAHVAAITEVEVREQIARDIEAQVPDYSEGEAARVREVALFDAAKTARGDSA